MPARLFAAPRSWRNEGSLHSSHDAFKILQNQCFKTSNHFCTCTQIQRWDRLFGVNLNLSQDRECLTGLAAASDSLQRTQVAHSHVAYLHIRTYTYSSNPALGRGHIALSDPFVPTSKAVTRRSQGYKNHVPRPFSRFEAFIDTQKTRNGTWKSSNLSKLRSAKRRGEVKPSGDCIDLLRQVLALASDPPLETEQEMASTDTQSARSRWNSVGDGGRGSVSTCAVSMRSFIVLCYIIYITNSMVVDQTQEIETLSARTNRGSIQ